MRAVGAMVSDRCPRISVVALVVLLCSGCGWVGGSSRPSWIDGSSAQFPSTQYLVGVGQADSRPQATEQAYAAVSRIFKAEITAQAKDWSPI
ncbi:MAG: LPP20 family lipoprotein [Nitrospira sp.]